MKSKTEDTRTPAQKKNFPRGNEPALNKVRAEVFAQQLQRHPPAPRPDGGEAFVREADGTSSDLYATEMGKDFLIAAETGREVLEELSDEAMPEDNGGPFVISTAGREFAEGVDASNPADAEPEPFPTVMRKSN